MATGAILIVDDEPQVRSTLAEALEYGGYDIDCAESALCSQICEPQRPLSSLLFSRLFSLWAPSPPIQTGGRDWRGLGSHRAPSRRTCSPA